MLHMEQKSYKSDYRFEIVDILLKEKIEIARRTVAKYRDVLGILPSSRRKKYFYVPIEEIKGSLTNSEEQEIAFGLKALIVYVRIDENIETGLVEDSLRNIQGVSSLDIIDYRRALE